MKTKILLMLLLAVKAGHEGLSVFRVTGFVNGVKHTFYVDKSAVQSVPLESAIMELMAKPNLKELLKIYADLFCTYEKKTQEEWALESAKYHHEPQTLDCTLRGGTIIALEDGFEIILPGITKLAGKVVDLQLTTTHPGKILDPEGAETELTISWEIAPDVPVLPLLEYGIRSTFRYQSQRHNHEA